MTFCGLNSIERSSQSSYTMPEAVLALKQKRRLR